MVCFNSWSTDEPQTNQKILQLAGRHEGFPHRSNCMYFSLRNQRTEIPRSRWTLEPDVGGRILEFPGGGPTVNWVKEALDVYLRYYYSEHPNQALNDMTPNDYIESLKQAVWLPKVVNRSSAWFMWYISNSGKYPTITDG